MSARAGLESMATWLLAASTVVASMRFATKRCSPGCTVRSLMATMYQLGFDLQAVSLILGQGVDKARVIARQGRAYQVKRRRPGDCPSSGDQSHKGYQSPHAADDPHPQGRARAARYSECRLRR